MIEFVKLIIGVAALILGIPIGNLLASQTREELEDGKKYFIILTWMGLIGGFFGLVSRNDVLMYSMFFIAIVTSRSLVGKKKKVNKKR